jgi:cobalt/nickel transport system permease protein
MHISDGLMAPVVWIAGMVIALAFVALAFHRVNRRMEDRTIPYMAILAAGIFLAQMLNFPIIGGTTGHLVGAALAVALLGPWSAIAVIFTILVIQSLVFGDGGITALGLNTLNMAIIGSLAAWGVMRLTPKRFKMPGIAVAAWASVFLGATACAIELAVSHAIDPSYGIDGIIALPSMMGLHSVIGVGEAIITTGVVAFLAKVAPETMSLGREGEPQGERDAA